VLGLATFQTGRRLPSLKIGHEHLERTLGLTCAPGVGARRIWRSHPRPALRVTAEASTSRRFSVPHRSRAAADLVDPTLGSAQPFTPQIPAGRTF
jgi:hypothetical protein